jgi:hypothetical protein
MASKSISQFSVEITQQQKFTVSLEAESEQEAIDLANAQYGSCECEYPPEILVEKTRIVK